MTNRFLELAEKVLEQQGVLTANQIWERAKAHPSIKLDKDWGKSPQIAIALALSADTQKKESKFCRTNGVPAQYHLKTLRHGWGDLEAQADYLARTVSLDDILAELKARPRQPVKKLCSVMAFQRDPYVIAAVRLRSNYSCELCGAAGFEKEDGTGYIEVHHLKTLADGGDDAVENAAALCPNCHRLLHFGRDRGTKREALIATLIAKGIKISS